MASGWSFQLDRSYSRIDLTLFVSRQRFGVLSGELGRSWLVTAKIARKAGHWQTAYSAILQAQESRTAFSLMQKVRLIRATGEPLRALQELEHYLQTTRSHSHSADADVIDLTEDEGELKPLKAKVSQILRCGVPTLHLRNRPSSFGRAGWRNQTATKCQRCTRSSNKQRNCGKSQSR